MSSSSAVVSLDQPAPEAEPSAEVQPIVPVNLPVDLPTMLRQLEDAYIRAALTRTQFNKKEAAKLLGMGRTTLVEKLRRRNLAARSA
jgi:sigma-54 specific flagellar transcriptional regulator A